MRFSYTVKPLCSGHLGTVIFVRYWGVFALKSEEAKLEEAQL